MGNGGLKADIFTPSKLNFRLDKFWFSDRPNSRDLPRAIAIFETARRRRVLFPATLTQFFCCLAVRLQLVLLYPQSLRQARPNIPKIPSGFSGVFVGGRSQEFSAKLAKKQNSKIELLSEQKTQTLWVGKLVKE